MLRNFTLVLFAAAAFLGTRTALADFTPGPGGSGYPHLVNSNGPASCGGLNLDIK